MYNLFYCRTSFSLCRPISPGFDRPNTVKHVEKLIFFLFTAKCVICAGPIYILKVCVCVLNGSLNLYDCVVHIADRL